MDTNKSSDSLAGGRWMNGCGAMIRSARIKCMVAIFGLLCLWMLEGTSGFCLTDCSAGELAEVAPAQPVDDERPPEPKVMVELDAGAAATVASPEPISAAPQAPETPTVGEAAAEAAATSAGNAVPTTDPPAEPLAISDGQSIIDAAARPAWVEMLPQRDGPVHATAVCSGPHQARDLEAALNDELKRQTDAYVQEYLGSSEATRYATLDFDIQQIRRDLLSPGKLYREPVQLPELTERYGELYQQHALLEFDAAFRSELDREWNTIVKTSHLKLTGVGCLGVLMFLGVLVAYFRLDTATRGFYTVRLQFVAAVAILTIAVAAWLLASLVPSV